MDNAPAAGQVGQPHQLAVVVLLERQRVRPQELAVEEVQPGERGGFVDRGHAALGPRGIAVECVAHGQTLEIMMEISEPSSFAVTAPAGTRSAPRSGVGPVPRTVMRTLAPTGGARSSGSVTAASASAYVGAVTVKACQPVAGLNSAAAKAVAATLAGASF